jgi:hypothetical protein
LISDSEALIFQFLRVIGYNTGKVKAEALIF